MAQVLLEGRLYIHVHVHVYMYIRDLITVKLSLSHCRLCAL